MFFENCTINTVIMKRSFIYGLLILIFAAGCTSTDKLIRKGQYDKAFKRALRKVTRNPNNEKEVYNLATAYNKVQQNSEDRISQLKASGRPDIWDQVYREYSKMNERYQKIKPLLPLQYKGQSLPVKHDDYFNFAENAKLKAAEYHYALGVKLLKSQNKEDIRNAYYEFEKVLNYFENYKNARQLKEEAYQKGINHIIVFVENHSKYKLYKDYLEALFDFDVSRLNRKWTDYEFVETNKIPQGDGYVKVVIDAIDISPERVENNTYTVEKEIVVGQDYVYDENGHIVTDSTGNPVTKPVMGKAKCIVKETHLKKDGIIKGTVLYIDRYSKIIKKSPIGADQHFEYAFARADGDLRVLDDRVRKLLKNDPAGFPPDETIIRDLFHNLSGALYSDMRKNRWIWK
jgi:hypothetical protein